MDPVSILYPNVTISSLAKQGHTKSTPTPNTITLLASHSLLHVILHVSMDSWLPCTDLMSICFPIHLSVSSHLQNAPPLTAWKMTFKVCHFYSTEPSGPQTVSPPWIPKQMTSFLAYTIWPYGYFIFFPKTESSHENFWNNPLTTNCLKVHI